MLNHKIVLHPKPYANGLKPVMVRIRYYLNGEAKYHYKSTGFTCKPNDWDKGKGIFKKSVTNAKKKNLTLKELDIKAERILLDFTVETLTTKAFDLAWKGELPKRTVLFFEFFECRMQEVSFGSAFSYRCTRDALLKYHPDKKLTFEQIDYSFLMGFEKYKRARGCNNRGIAKDMGVICALYGEAIRRGFVSRDKLPFQTKYSEGYNIGKLKSEYNPRPFDKEDFVKFLSANPKDKKLRKWWLMALFSAACNGMNFVDMAKLKRADIYNGRVNFHRQKTRNKKFFSIKLDAIMVYVLKEFYDEDSEYVFPIYSAFHKTEQQKYNRKHKVLGQYNKAIKQICEMQGIENWKAVTSYTFRHTFGSTLADELEVPVATIQQIFGHSSQDVTMHYIKQIGYNTTDRDKDKWSQYLLERTNLVT